MGSRLADGSPSSGSISSVMLGGTLLALNWELYWMYYLMSVPMIFGTFWILILANIRPRTLGAPTEAPRGAHA